MYKLMPVTNCRSHVGLSLFILYDLDKFKIRNLFIILFFIMPLFFFLHKVSPCCLLFYSTTILSIRKHCKKCGKFHFLCDTGLKINCWKIPIITPGLIFILFSNFLLHLKNGLFYIWEEFASSNATSNGLDDYYKI